jgi:hypothetical protein
MGRIMAERIGESIDKRLQWPNRIDHIGRYLGVVLYFFSRGKDRLACETRLTPWGRVTNGW